MRAPDSLILRFGVSSGLRALQLAAAALGASAIAIAPAGAAWKLGAWAALALVTAWVQASSIGRNRSGWLELAQDGTACWRFDDGKKARGRLRKNAWAIRRFCVLVLFERDSGRNYHCVVCASGNTPDEFRRLLKFLNMRAPAATLQKADWW